MYVIDNKFLVTFGVFNFDFSKSEVQMAKTEGFNLKENLKDDYDVNDLGNGDLSSKF